MKKTDKKYQYLVSIESGEDERLSYTHQLSLKIY